MEIGDCEQCGGVRCEERFHAFLVEGVSPAEQRSHMRDKVDGGVRSWRLRKGPRMQLPQGFAWSATIGGVDDSTTEQYRKDVEAWALVEAEPFAGIEVTLDTRLYVSFLKEPVEGKMEIPYETPEKDFRILSASGREVCSVLTLNPNMRTTDSMAILEQAFGSRLTTRNWNTVLKIAEIDW